MSKREKQSVPFQQVITALLDDTKPFPVRYIYRFSDIEGNELALLQKKWDQVPLRRRQAVMEDVEEFNSDFILNFFEIATLGARDPDALIRLMAVRTLTEYDNLSLVPLFINAAEQDEDMPVRTAATAALGRLVYQGEIEEIPEASLRQVESCLLAIYNGQDAKPVRLQALKSLGFSSRDEIPDMIQSAYQSDDSEWIAAALAAMGRSYNKIYRKNVLEALSDDRPAVRSEAISAAGELEMSDAAPVLLEALEDSDSDVRYAAIWALSQIGGDNVRDALEQMLADAEDEEEEDFLEAALENLEFTEDIADFSMLDFEDSDLDESTLFDKDGY